MTHRSELTETQAYNSRLQPATIRAWSTNGTVLDLAYSFSLGTANNGNVAQITNNLNTARTQSFTYDELNRIKTASTQATTGTYAWGLSFGYDIWGNLLSASVTQGSAPMLSVSVNANNRITNTGFSHDTAGNMMADGVNSYLYGAESRVKTAAGVTYTYDGDGKRVQKSSGKLYWYAMGSDPLTETDAAGNNPTEFVFFNGKRIARRDSSGAISYYFADHLGTARVVTDATGTILDDSDFYPFGGERAVLSSSGNTYKFTGKERDSESGLDNFGARYNSSNLGRFMSPDPDSDSGVEHQDDPQSWNGYAYARNNPLLYTDPGGRVFCREATEGEKDKGITEVCDVTNSEFVKDPSKYQGYSHYDCSCDTKADKAAYANFLADQLPAGVADMLHQVGVTADNGVKAGALFMAENAAGVVIGRAIGLGIQAINAARAANVATGLTPGAVFNAGKGLLSGEAVLSSHAVQQAAARGVTQGEIAEALSHVPKQYAGDGSVIRFIGQAAEVRVNKVTGTIVTVIRKLSPGAPSPLP